MREGIHPQYTETQVSCSCGNSFTTRSTSTKDSLTVETCSACHPFYTGKQRILDSGGRVARFEARYGKRAAGKAAAN
ncbi:50S ribosomal protein L31 [Pseudonocardia ailaonensis]|uniref:Large ribosomal subunit protein bL31 n=1 Tax=Pseudonocardia ailaonensis TaxID=367279 RepID=A0ABN2NM36_9PSEU